MGALINWSGWKKIGNSVIDGGADKLEWVEKNWKFGN